MNLKKLMLICCITAISTLSFAQKTAIHTDELKDYKHAIELYKDKSYLASQQLFNKIRESYDKTTELRANCEYYVANCAIRLNQRGADDMMLDFVKRYPTSTKRNNAFLETADYYFKVRKYSYALKWYGKANTNNLSIRQKEDFNFKNGYALFATKNYEKSKTYFKPLLDSQKYGSQAKYYYGYIAYSEDDYDTANEYLGQVVTDESYKKDVSYYLADINFKSGKFEKAIELGEPLLSNAKREEHSQISKIVGESYFNLGNYNKAIEHLKNYKGTRGKWNNTDYYMLGYAFYKKYAYEEAISYFNKIINGDNAVAQNAYYHLAECYLKLDKKSEALNAFRNASQMEFKTKLQEDAYLNYAKLSYEIGNPYKNVPEVLQDYLKKYPKSTHKKEIEGLIISAYLTSQDYAGAIKYLEEKKETNNSLYQKAAFYRGIQVFNGNVFDEAIISFDKSLSQNIDKSIGAQSLYWKGDSNFRLNNFNAALANFKAFSSNSEARYTDEYKNLNYNLAYTYFKQKEYQKAGIEFQNYINTNPEDEIKLNDSYLRLADTYFVTSNYQNAINSYDKIVQLNTSDADYAQFQKAVSYGFIHQDQKKIDELNTFLTKYPTSKYRDDGYYVLANEYVDANEIDKALEKYDYLIDHFKRSPLVSKSMLKKGVIYYNTDRNEEALLTYKQIVRQFPNTPEARQAVASARQIYVDLGRVDEYADWVKDIDFVNVTDADLDNDMYESAEKQYLQSNHQNAISGFNKYLDRFPRGLHTLPSHFYLAQSYYSEKQINKTIPHYKYVIDQEQGEFTEQALTRLAQAYLEADNWSNAIPVLERLENESNDIQNTIFAQSNLMKGYYKQENYTKAVEYAEKVLGQSRADNQMKSDAQIIIARSAIKTNNETKARSAYKKVETIASGELKAEALYYSAYFEHQDGSYRVSNKVVQKIASDYSVYKYWGGKALIIMAKNHYELKDSFQATYILESVIKNFSQFDDVVTEAQTELNRIKTEEAKTNFSVTPGN
ncbi:MAG: tetratricopeptide repeat protein [Flavobacteriaceae bacterium]|nr:tetratricopeptide repeat protein [Flavobacteriaceae bacterium]